MSAPAIALLFALFVGSGVSNDSLPRVSPEEAAKHLVTWAKPVYPPVGRSIHLQGSVSLEITISESGTVTNVKAISGNPILLASALDSVKKWQYSPFLLNGKPAVVQTTVAIPFVIEEPVDEAKLKKEAQANDKFFAVRDICSRQVEADELVKAESTCNQAITLSADLDPARKLERAIAFRLMGNALFLQRKFAAALENYQKELEFIEEIGEPDGSELAAAQHHVANGLWGAGRRGEADAFYSKAEATYRRAHEHIGSEFLKSVYTRNLKSVLTDHAALLRDMGDPAKAAALEKQASALVIKSGVRD